MDKYLSPIYDTLDEGIQDTVNLLRSKGINTWSSCEGGPGHAYSFPTIVVSPDNEDQISVEMNLITQILIDAGKEDFVVFPRYHVTENKDVDLYIFIEWNTLEIDTEAHRFDPPPGTDYEEMDTAAVWQDTETGESGIIQPHDVIGLRVVASDAHGKFVTTGEVIGFCPVPMVLIRRDDEVWFQRDIWHRIDLCDFSDPEDDAMPSFTGLLTACKLVKAYYDEVAAGGSPALDDVIGVVNEALEQFENESS